MAFTQNKVRIVSDYASEISHGRFGLMGIGGDTGHGVRYIDKREQKVWLGSQGARQAASYYLGVIDAFNAGYNGGTIGDLPEFVNAVRNELLRNAGWYQSHYDQGHSDVHYAQS